jgi:hypothetical protein
MRNKKMLELTAVILLLLAGSVWIGGRSLMSFDSMDGPQNLPVSAFFETEGQRIELEVARTRKEQASGLQFRATLPSDRGMLFPVEPATTVELWMKDVNFPLDMIFLREGIIIEIAEQVPPCKSAPCPLYGPDKEVDAVVEVSGGVARQLDMEEGDRIEIQSQ